MKKLEKPMKSLVVLAVILLVVVYVMLDRRFGGAPELENADEYTILPATQERGIDESALVSQSSYTSESVDFDYDVPLFSPAFGARNKEIRLILAKFFGGGEHTENAVEMGLDYLARVQSDNGSWSAANHPYGSTSLALLAFLGAGYTHETGKHKDTVNKGLNYLLKAQMSEGNLNVSEQMYTQGMAGTVFSEAYAMTGDSTLRDAAMRMLAWLAKTQGPKGGWGYGPYSPEMKDYRYDTSVTGWVIMAFKSAHIAEIPISKKAIELYKEYAMTITADSGAAYYAIAPGGELKKPIDTMTASTVMCRFYVGESQNAKLMGKSIHRITTGLPRNLVPKWEEKDGKMDNYMWYHAAQAAFLAGRQPWVRWNDMLTGILVKNQFQNGDRKGAWEDKFFKWSGRSATYATTMNILILETYYRYYY